MPRHILCSMKEEKKTGSYYTPLELIQFMVDYLENVCAHRYKRMRKNEKNLEVIRTEAGESQKLSGAQKASQRAAAVVKKQDEELAIPADKRRASGTHQ